MKALTKRICSYFDNEFDRASTQDNTTIQYLNYVFKPRFSEYTRSCCNAPAHRVICSLIRREPRDMVKLMSKYSRGSI